jgi:hypothetical protein
MPAVEGSAFLDGIRDRVAHVREPGGEARPSRTDELERLAKLRTDGALTEEEFAAAKAELFA